MPIPVSLDDAKRQLRQGGDAIDAEREAEINGFISRAAGWVERYTGHILAARNVTEQFVGFDRVHLRAWPIQPAAVPVVSYAPSAGQALPVADVRMLVSNRPARALPQVGSRWPAVPRGAIVTITVRAGYEPGDTVPEDFRSAMLVLIAAYDADREGGDLFQKAEATARALCSSYRMRSL